MNSLLVHCGSFILKDSEMRVLSQMSDILNPPEEHILCLSDQGGTGEFVEGNISLP